jgi:AraC family transcriptional regulator of adaptative response/methylated-DNA-[protein]-cysteine methyltransferase
MTPATYRKGGAGEAIRFSTAACPLGRLLVAATRRGVCAVVLGDADPALEAELAAEFPRASLHRDDRGLQPWLRAVRDALGGAARTAAPRPVPLDLRGTAFQLGVWAALREIPAGETRSYGAVAAALGRPRAVRAVAGACARNRVAVLVPCHRVVRETGQLGGYRWGLERKRRLLAAEHARAGLHEEAASGERRAHAGRRARR